MPEPNGPMDGSVDHIPVVWIPAIPAGMTEGVVNIRSDR